MTNSVAVENVAKALYDSEKLPAYLFDWDSSENDHRQLYRGRAKVCIDAYEALIKEEVSKAASTPNKPRFSEHQEGGLLGHRVFVPTPVLQEWVVKLPLMQQTVLLTCIRGPDGVGKYSPVKLLLRWYRRCILLSAMDGKVLTNPVDTNGGSFTGPSLSGAAEWQKEEWGHCMHEVVYNYMRELDTIPLHFHTHLIHGAQVVGYKHPNIKIAEWWVEVYIRFVNQLHLHPESHAEMDKRLSDNRDACLERNDTATVD